MIDLLFMLTSKLVTNRADFFFLKLEVKTLCNGRENGKQKFWQEWSNLNDYLFFFIVTAK